MRLKRFAAASLIAVLFAMAAPAPAEAAVSHPIECLASWGKIGGSLAYMVGLGASGFIVPPMSVYAALGIIATAWVVIPYQAYHTANACR